MLKQRLLAQGEHVALYSAVKGRNSFEYAAFKIAASIFLSIRDNVHKPKEPEADLGFRARWPVREMFASAGKVKGTWAIIGASSSSHPRSQAASNYLAYSGKL